MLHVLCMCVCVCMIVALGIQHAMRVFRVILLSVASPTLQHFSILSRKRKYFRGGGGGREEFLGVKCILWFSLQLLSKTFSILRRIQGI